MSARSIRIWCGWAGLCLLLALGSGWPSPAAAYSEAAPIFRDELAQYGNWADYGNYGPVWYPTTVSSNWRPYLDGRWVPTADGWVFESDEPWAWATYHFGNWMPTDEYGWVWSPGNTWYPSTVAWRNSDDFIGWAPIPPPNYVPTQAYYPPGGYVPSASPLDLLTAPFWLFATAPNFLLGFNQPYLPTYSYYNCGCMAPFSFFPFLFPRTRFIRDSFFLAFAPNAFFFFGPPFPFVSQVTNINIVRINNFVKNVNIVKVRNVVPPQRVLANRPLIRQAVPEPLLKGEPLKVERAANLQQAQRAVARPDVVPPARGAAVPEARGPSRAPEVIRGMQREGGRPEEIPIVRGPERFRGTRLPPQSGREPREMQQQLQRQRQLERRQVPFTERGRMQREEQQLRRQEIFRQPASRFGEVTPRGPALQPSRPMPVPQRGPSGGFRPMPAPARPAPAPGGGHGR